MTTNRCATSSGLRASCENATKKTNRRAGGRASGNKPSRYSATGAATADRSGASAPWAAAELADKDASVLLMITQNYIDACHGETWLAGPLGNSVLVRRLRVA